MDPLKPWFVALALQSVTLSFWNQTSLNWMGKFPATSDYHGVTWLSQFPIASIQIPIIPTMSPLKHTIFQWWYPLVISHGYGKSPCLMRQSTISLAIFNSFLYVYQRVMIATFKSLSGHRPVPLQVGQKVGGDASAHGFRQSLLPGWAVWPRRVSAIVWQAVSWWT